MFEVMQSNRQEGRAKEEQRRKEDSDLLMNMKEKQEKDSELLLETLHETVNCKFTSRKTKRCFLSYLKT